jgi:hypothetical protein
LQQQAPAIAGTPATASRKQVLGIRDMSNDCFKFQTGVTKGNLSTYRNNAIFATNLFVSFPCFEKKKDGFKTGLPNERKVLFVFATVDEEFAQQEICEKFDWQIHSAVTARWRDTPNTQSQQGVHVYTMTEIRFSRTKTAGHRSEKETYIT